MLIIRKQQMDALRAYMRERFVDGMLGHVREHFPEDFEVLGEAQTRRVIELGIDRAAAHGLDTKGSVRKYLTLMFILGSYFDEDPLLPWVAEILEEGGRRGSAARMAELYAEAIDYSGRIAGENGEYYQRALLRAHQRPLESLFEVNTSDLTQDIRSGFRNLYPQRYRALTESSLNNLADLGRASAERYVLGTREGVLVYVGLMFMLGSHFDRDPLHPWAAEVLQDKSVTDPVLKARKLYHAAMARLDQYININRSMGRR